MCSVFKDVMELRIDWLVDLMLFDLLSSIEVDRRTSPRTSSSTPMYLEEGTFSTLYEFDWITTIINNPEEEQGNAINCLNVALWPRQVSIKAHQQNAILEFSPLHWHANERKSSVIIYDLFGDYSFEFRPTCSFICRI